MKKDNDARTFQIRAVTLLFKAVIIMVLIAVTALFGFLYVMQTRTEFYILTIGSALFLTAGIFVFARDYQGFRESMDQGLFEPNVQLNPVIERIETEFSDTRLLILRDYHNGTNYEEIAKLYRLGHAETSRREVRKGIGFLLTFYKEHKENVE